MLGILSLFSISIPTWSIST